MSKPSRDFTPNNNSKDCKPSNNRTSNGKLSKPNGKGAQGRPGRGKDPKPIPDNTGNSRQRREEEAFDTLGKEIRSTSNPWTWYGSFEHFSRDVSNITFGTPVGQPIRIGTGDTTVNAGLMVIRYIPTPGNSVDATSPLNRQATRFQSYLKSKLRFAAKFDAADTMIYMMEVDSLYSYHALLTRAYRAAQLFTPTNKYYPRRLLQGMGIDPDDILFNLADFRSYINEFGINIGRFAMPSSFDINERHMWMNSGLYLDSNTSRAQTYMFVPIGFYQYDNTVTTGSQLTMKFWMDESASPTLHTFQEIVQFGNTLLTNFENDDDTMDISGLFEVAFEGNLRHMTEVQEGEVIIPVYDETVLSQIENSVAVGQPRSQQTVTGAVRALNITQNPAVNNGAIIFDGYYLGGRNTGIANLTLYNYPLMYAAATLNAHTDSPTPEQIMEMTRLVPVTERDVTPSATPINLGLQSHGADLVVDYLICVTNPSNLGAVNWLQSTTNTVWVNSNGTLLSGGPGLDWIALSEQFDWAPLIYVVQVIPVAEGNPTLDFRFFAADVDNMTAVSATQMYNIHEAAMLSLLEVRSAVTT